MAEPESTASSRKPNSRHSKEIFMPFARIDLVKGKSKDYRATVADVVYQGIVSVLKAPDGDRFVSMRPTI
jgi:hypothetical protein